MQLCLGLSCLRMVSLLIIYSDIRFWSSGPVSKRNDTFFFSSKSKINIFGAKKTVKIVAPGSNLLTPANIPTRNVFFNAIKIRAQSEVKSGEL